MGVYINMEMPENCFECELKTAPGENYWICAGKKKHIPIPSELKNLCDETGAEPIFQPPDFCPLIEIPPHGRLIDADALDKQIYNDIPLKVFGNIARMAEMRNIVFNAPTIIPAGEEN